MRIANYLRPECVTLHQRADSLEGAVQQLVALLDGTEDLTDTAAFAADVRARLALGGVCVGNGLAIPHAKSASVKRLQLAALTLDPPLACDTPDGKPLQMLVMIAAPAEANDLHVQVLAELATLFLDTDFCTHLRESTTPDAFCRAVAEREAQDDPAAPPPQTTDEPGYRLLGVTACPTGIAHTYLAAEALQRAAQTRGFSIKVETNGADGVGDALTEEDIRAADCIIVAADRAVSMARFVGKRLVYASAGDAVRDADALLEKAVSGKAPIYHGGHAFRTSDLRELGREGYGHLMNGVSHMIPIVVAGGVITALSLLSQQLGLPASWTMMMKNVGSAAFVMMYPRAGCLHRVQHRGPPRLYARPAGRLSGTDGHDHAHQPQLDLKRLLGGTDRRLCRRFDRAAAEPSARPDTAGAEPHKDRAARPRMQSFIHRLADAYGRQSAAGPLQPVDVALPVQDAGRQPPAAGRASGRHDGHRLRRTDQ